MDYNKNCGKLFKIILETKIRLLKEGYKNDKESIDIFWFAHKGNSLPGEQNKIGFIKDNGDNYIQQLESIYFYPKIIEN